MAAVGKKGESQSFMVELSISAKNLINRDITSKSDPICVIFARDKKSNEFIEIGKTEIIKDNLNPTWVDKIMLEYRFEERLELNIVVYDFDGDVKKQYKANAEYLGCVFCTLGEIVAAPFSKFERKLELPKNLADKNKGKDSMIVIYAEEMGDNKESFQMTLSGKGLDKKDLLGKSDPFLIISKKNDDDEGWTQVFTTEVAKKTLDPEWRPITGHTVKLTGRNPTRPLLFSVFDHDKHTKHDLIGEFETNWEDLCRFARQSNPIAMPLINPKKKEKKKSYENSGVLNIDLKVDETNYSFLDYLQTGVQLHFTVAIDFTASNGNPNDAKSLHSRTGDQDNQYTTAIKSVGSIIEDYDFDKHFPALGFGAKIPPEPEVSHLFFLNFDPQNPFCKGVDGILEAYHQVLRKVKFYGPTHFAPTINHVAEFAKTYQDGRHYFALLIITDGMICDLDATRQAIVEASSLPLSIIIVGVGNEDFSSMEFLDGDKRALKHNGVPAARDIVQFIALRDVIGKFGNDHAATRAALGKLVLAEIPRQLCEFMHMRKGGSSTHTQL